jgi:hypothetical protein
MVNNCNEIFLNVLQYTLKHYNKIIKAYDIKIPKDIQLPDIIIKYYQILNYSNNYGYI